MGQQTVRLSVEVRSGSARFRVRVQAESIRKALAMMGGRYPHGEVGVAFPIEPEGLFVTEPSSPAGIVGSGHAHLKAA